MCSSRPNPEPPWRAGLRGARANLVPGLVLQAAALVLVVAYYRHPPTHAAVEELAAVHERWGLGFGVISTGLFGGLIPVLFLRSQRATRERFSLGGATLLVAFWSYKGIEVDLWYRLLAYVVGENSHPATVVTKMAFDQFGYCPVLAVPVTVLVYEWIEARFDGRAVRADIRRGGWYRRRVLPVLISNAGVWIPAVCIIYTLPTPLQLPLQNLVLCFFTLLLAHMIPRRRPDTAEATAGRVR